MTNFRNTAGTEFPALRPSMVVIELLLALAAAALTAAIWLLVGLGAFLQETHPARAGADAAGVVHVTLPPMIIAGQRDPVTASASNTTSKYGRICG